MVKFLGSRLIHGFFDVGNIVDQMSLPLGSNQHACHILFVVNSILLRIVHPEFVTILKQFIKNCLE